MAVWLKLLLHTFWCILQCIFNDFYYVLFVAFNSGKRYCRRLDATSYQSSDRNVLHLCLWLQNEHEWQLCKEFAPHPGGTKDNNAHVCEPNYITVQNKIIAKILPVNKFTTLKIFVTPSFNEWVVFSWLLCSAGLQYMFIQIGSQTLTSLPFEVWIPRRAAARARFLVTNKVAGQFYLGFDTR